MGVKILVVLLVMHLPNILKLICLKKRFPAIPKKKQKKINPPQVCLQPTQPLRKDKTIVFVLSRVLGRFKTRVFVPSRELGKVPISCRKSPGESGRLFHRCLLQNDIFFIFDYVNYYQIIN
jgi:hypothetical protein